MKLAPETQGRLDVLVRVLDRYSGRYRERVGKPSIADYLAARDRTDDEEILTEPVLSDLLQELLGFPVGAFFPQLSKSGLKPDFTPTDLVAHQFVFDAKSSAIGDLDAHEPQIRAYIDQRGLRFGVLFNLRELRVYRRGARGHDAALSFQLLPLWQVARGEAIPIGEVERFEAFLGQFSHRALGLEDRIQMIRQADPWRVKEARGEQPAIDVEYLVDRLRALSWVLDEDVAAQDQALDRELRFKAGLEPALLAELRTLAADVEPGVDDDRLPRTVAGFRSGDGTAGRAWRQYRLRVAQLALTRILLYRSWEDAGFVAERLYDGGFGRLYDEVGQRVPEVLAAAFGAGRERYEWLYGGASTYDWYRPGEDALVEVLYTLLPVPLGKLDADVLGGLYESYVEEIDRDRLGQFYTPRSVVRFMLDRVGLDDPDALFNIAGDQRRPRKLLDFATGSGGFLVEAARRIVDAVGDGDATDVDDGLEAIVNGLHGCEISPFPYYLTEVNLLLQVSRLLGRLRELGKPLPHDFTLGVVHADTLATRRGPDDQLPSLDSGALPGAELEDQRFGLVPLDREKAVPYERMRREGEFELVVGNPPYVFESGNKALFERLRALPAWKDTYRGKGDYLYYFLILAAERLAPGGRMAVITPAGWMNAGAADLLRERLASTLQLDELFLFGSYRVFAPEQQDARDRRRAQSPTVESLILIATKGIAPPGHRMRITALEDEHAAADGLHPGEGLRVPERDALLDEMGRRADAGRGGRRGGIFVHLLRQDSLRHSEPWPVKFGERDLAARIVAHLDRALATSDEVEPLGSSWSIVRGIETGADGFKGRIQRRMGREDLDALAAAGRRTGDPILELPPGAEKRAPWTEHPTLLARSVEPHAILYGALDESNYTSLVWIGRGDEVAQDVQDALEPWHRVLATRAEFARNPRRRWFETAWPRDKDQLRKPKVIALYRTDRGRFAVDEYGEWQPSNKTTICTAKLDGPSVTYLGGLLNSELLDLWYAVRGKAPRDIWRNYEPKPMARIPYRSLDLSGAPSARADALAAASDHTHRLAACDAILEASASDAELGHALERIVRALADNRRELLPLRTIAPALTATVKDPWLTEPPELDEAAVLSTFPEAATVSVRVDRTLSAKVTGDGVLGHPHLDDNDLQFRHGRRVTAVVVGDEARLELLARLLHGRSRMLAAELEGILLPKNHSGFKAEVSRRADEIDELLAAGRDLVERAERLVCRLYRVPADLEDEVVAHAIARAARAVPQLED